MQIRAGIHDSTDIYRWIACKMLSVSLSGYLTGVCRLKLLTSRCKTLFTHPQPRPSTAGSSSTSNASTSKVASRRTIGTDKNPIDMAYYDILGLESQCTTEEIKKAYRRLAIKVRPGSLNTCPLHLTYSCTQTKTVMIQMQRRRSVGM